MHEGTNVTYLDYRRAVVVECWRQKHTQEYPKQRVEVTM